MKILAKESTLPPGREGFLTWFYNEFPHAYAMVEARSPTIMEPSHIGLGEDAPVAPATPATGAVSNAPSWVETVRNIAMPMLQLYQQKKVLDLQLKRAQLNQPPLDIADYMGDASVRTGLDTSTQKTLLMVVGIVGGVFLLSRFMGHRSARA